MTARKRVLITVGPGLISGKRHMTQRSLVTALDRYADLLVVPAGGYDFTADRVRAYRRIRGGRFEELGMIEPLADLWIVYSDGYYLDHRTLGFARRREFFEAQMDFHQRQVAAGRVGCVVNEPHVEARTLKSWFSTLNAELARVIPTHVFSSMDDVYEFQRQEGAVVAKLDWGGAGAGALRLTAEADLRSFEDELANDPCLDIEDYCFQPYMRGDEKRLWFVGGEVVAARRSRGRATPWSEIAPDYAVSVYGEDEGEFEADVVAAKRLCALSGLTVGCIDFIGERINEINGCGTIFTEYQDWDCVVDARPALVNYFIELVSN